MNDNIFDKLSGLDDDSVNEINERFPDMKNDEAERIFRKTMEKIGTPADFSGGDSVSGIERVKRRNIWVFGSIAAAFIVAVVAVPVMLSAIRRTPDPSPVDADENRPQLMEITTAATVPATSADAKIPEITPTTAAMTAENTCTSPKAKDTVPAVGATLPAKGTVKTSTPVKTTRKAGISTNAAVTTKKVPQTTDFANAAGSKFRADMIASGKLPKNQPRLSLEQAKEIVRNAELQWLHGAAKLDSIRTEFDKIAGAPDSYWGSGIAHYIYYLDDGENESVSLNYSGSYDVEYVNSKTGESCLLTQIPVSFMNLEQLENAEKHGWTSVYPRRRSILSGELPNNQPRLTVSQVQAILDEITDNDMQSPVYGDESEYLRRLNAVHGKPDETYGSGMYYYCYYLDDYATETITIEFFEGWTIYRNEKTGYEQRLVGKRRYISDMDINEVQKYEQNVYGGEYRCERQRKRLSGELSVTNDDRLTLNKAYEIIRQCGSPKEYCDEDWFRKVCAGFDRECGAPDVFYPDSTGHKLYAEYFLKDYENGIRRIIVTCWTDSCEGLPTYNCTLEYWYNDSQPPTNLRPDAKPDTN